MASSKTGFCGDGCSFDTGDIDCSMAFRMVESTIRRIMGGLEGRKGDEIVFAGLITSNDAASVFANPQHRSSKFPSPIARQRPSHNSSSPQTPLSCSSSAPLLAQLESIPWGLDDLSLRGSPQAVSTPFAPSGRTREDISQPANYADTSPTPRLPKRLSSPELQDVNPFAIPLNRDQFRRDFLVRAKGELQLPKPLLCCGMNTIVDHRSANTFSSPSQSRPFRLSEQAASSSKKGTAVSISLSTEHSLERTG
jgi:hypothetical protein